MNRRFTLAATSVLLVVVTGAGLAMVLHRKRLEAPPKAAGFVPRPEIFVTDIGKSEALYDVVTKAIKGTFLKGLRDGDPALVQKGLTADFLARFPLPTDGRVIPDTSLDIREFDKSPLVDLPGDKFLALVRTFTGGWVHVERTTWRPFLFLADPSEKTAYCELHFQLAGPLPDDRRVDLSCSARAQAVLEGDTWKLRRFEWIEGTRVEGRQPPWREITDSVGLHFNESDDVADVKQQVINNRDNTWFGSLSVVDYNRDGFWDILASVGGQTSIMFLNDGRGGFERTPTPAHDAPSTPATWLVLDLDGDGVEEFVTTRVNTYGEGKGWFDLYHRKGSEWERLDRALEFPNPREFRQIAVSAILPVDINRDGLMDLYFCAYSNNSSLHEDFNSLASYDGNQDFFFINHGNLRFTEEAEARGIKETQFTFTGKFWDFDFDGDLDLLHCNDYGPNVLWKNDGTGHFTRDKDHIFAQGSNYTMGISISDYDNTGTWAVHISNMYSHAGNRIVPLASGLSEEVRQTANVLAQGNQQYECDPVTKVWRECGVERRINWADWAWACIFADFDNDTEKDLYVANGFTSNSDATKPDY